MPPPPWLRWAVIFFLCFAVISGIRKGTPEAPNPVHDAFQNAGDELAPNKLLPIDNYKNKLFPRYEARLQMADDAPGQGLPVVCGQRVALAYQAQLADGTPIADTAGNDAPLRFRIGESTAMPALEQGVIGMKRGGKRRVFAPASLAYGVETFRREDVPPTGSVRFDMELLALEPALPDPEEQLYRIQVLQNGMGEMLACGQPASIHVTIWDIRGQKLFTTKDEPNGAITFTPGKSEVFLGLEQSVVGMQRGGIRSLIVSPAFQITMDGNEPAVHFPLPENETVLVDVEALP